MFNAAIRAIVVINQHLRYVEAIADSVEHHDRNPRAPELVKVIEVFGFSRYGCDYAVDTTRHQNVCVSDLGLQRFVGLTNDNMVPRGISHLLCAYDDIGKKAVDEFGHD